MSSRKQAGASRRPGGPPGPKKPPPPGRKAAAGPPRLDATNLAGLTTLMNIQHVRADVDLEDAEKHVLGRPTAGGKVEKVDPVRLYTQELNNLAAELGIDFLDDSAGGAPAPSAPASARGAPPRKPPPARGPPPRGNAIDDLLAAFDLGGLSSDEDGSDEDGSDEDGSDEDGSDEDGSDEDGSDEDGSDEDGSDEDDSDDDEDGSDDGSDDDEDEDGSDDDDSDGGSSAASSRTGRALASMERGLGIDPAGTRRRAKDRRRIHAVPVAPPRRQGQARPSADQVRRSHISSVMGDMRHATRTSFSVERERAQDVKASKLEQIGQLRSTLEEEGIDCSSVGNPSMTSAADEIDSVLSILKLKNDRNRYSSMAEEVILGLAEGVETVFDGSRAVPVVGWQPDYTGYHNTIAVKLHRMRFETSQVVGSVIENYSIGATSRIIMELLPSFFLYPRLQQKQRAAPGLDSDPSAGGRSNKSLNAYNAIRQSDLPNPIESMAGI